MTVLIVSDGRTMTGRMVGTAVGYGMTCGISIFKDNGILAMPFL